MTSSAGAVSAAGMLKVKAKIHGDIEQRFRLAMFLVGKLAVLELKGLVLGQERNLDGIRSGRVERGGAG